MGRTIDPEIRRLHEEVAARQIHVRGAQPIAELLSRLLARKGYAQLQSADDRAEAWSDVVGPQLAKDSCVGNVRRGVLEVTVRNSAVVQELTFQKKRILREITAAIPELKVRDIRFRVGPLD